MRWFTNAAFFVMLAPGAILADVGPPPGFKEIPITGVVAVNTELGDYVFLLKRTWSYRGPRRNDTTLSNQGTYWQTGIEVQVVRLVPGSPMHAKGQPRSGYTLYAIPRAEVDPTRSPEELAALVDQGKISAAIRESIAGTKSIANDDPSTEVVVHYRIDRSPDGHGLILARLDATAQNDKSVYAGKSVAWVVAGVAASIGIFACCFWQFKRRRRRVA